MDNTETNQVEDEKVELETDSTIEEVIEATQDSDKEPSEVDYKGKYFYLAAEMDNMQKRMAREKSQTIKFSNERVLKDMISVLDTFELTMNAIKMDKDEKVQNIVVGLEMVSKQFTETLKSHGLQKIDCLGKEFDPNFHEALSKEEVEGKKSMEIIKVEQSGYILNDRVLRASKVIVAS